MSPSSAPRPMRDLSRTLREWAERLDHAQEAGDSEAARQVLQEFAQMGSELWLKLRQQQLAHDAGSYAAHFAEGLVDKLLDRAGLKAKPARKRRS